MGAKAGAAQRAWLDPDVLGLGGGSVLIQTRMEKKREKDFHEFGKNV